MSDLERKLFETKRLKVSLEPIEEQPTERYALDNTQKEVRHLMNESWRNTLFEQRKKLLTFEDKFYRDSTHYVQTYYLPPELNDLPVLVCHHGAGSSSLTFLAFISALKSQTEYPRPGVFLFDMFGHGRSTDRPEKNYELDALTDDFSFIMTEFLARTLAKRLFFIGHSLGGSIMTNFLARDNLLLQKVSGLALLDIVEETAVRSLNKVSFFLKSRPRQFNDYEDAMYWHLNSKLLNNEESAKLSIYDLFTEDAQGCLKWRADLEGMAHFWGDWFLGMSEKFLRCDEPMTKKIPKLLVLAGNEHLDKDLIIGQMQGKYQLLVFDNLLETGHFIQEDIPKKLSISILEFLKRHDIAYIERTQTTRRSLWGGSIH
uniref:Protein phosphatase methylesterase 1 n=1 Tax=Candidozyma auris TaxID=498019 RepID=A0A0L0P6R4_CANAR